MIAIGIPTYNEAKNISKLTSLIDRTAAKIGLDIIIINADNNSPDHTAAIFLATNTTNKKNSIVTNEKGKGSNIKAILDVVSTLDTCEGCIFIDGDITSFSESWLRTFVRAIRAQADFIVPNYARDFQEGNTTNHFVYPLTFYHTNGNCPRQPIAGDFGLSMKFIQFLVHSAHWHTYCYGYGIDIFLTLQALYNHFRVDEVNVERKEHNPSFGKMIDMFVEVASSYYETSTKLFEANQNNGVFQAIMNGKHPSKLFAPKMPLCQTKIVEREKEANQILASTETLSKIEKNSALISSVWGQILLDHERNIGQVDSFILAQSILPYYLLRVVHYLQHNSNAQQAENTIKDVITFMKRHVK
ncbi:glycosyltransferase family 2 protein [Bacillus thuringiensis]|uniref:glycosyltransferase family 2 protein n=1 Tax=Bacillus thuringiensis TaxID=1428 RepID=UPI000786EDF0|nr:glycosyltransferase family 2 protein [Bacillus thuringiensis]HDR7713409.1 glycosyltransferase family 2 protein [Bacillus cereus]AMR88278.1 hypothetical protein A3L20_30165 [Bacillus thuringiensis]MBG9636042.1 hypothetical protein [Bacillus thuringiensis]MBG9675912.1 hypothetical protein [Bacillus thuringiensis]MEC3298326.1 glycosyltransferase family 2 protein [Bacillus thuringiensis]